APRLGDVGLLVLVRHVDHHRGEAQADGAHARGEAGAVVEVDGHRHAGALGEVAHQGHESVAAVLEAALGQRHDDRAARLLGGFDDGLRDLEGVGVEGAHAVLARTGSGEDLEAGYESHGASIRVGAVADRDKEPRRLRPQPWSLGSRRGGSGGVAVRPLTMPATTAPSSASRTVAGSLGSRNTSATSRTMEETTRPSTARVRLGGWFARSASTWNTMKVMARITK